MGLGDLAQAAPALAIAEDSFVIQFERPAANMAAIEAGAPHSGFDSLLVLLVCLAVIVVLAALLYAVGRNYISALAGIAELRSTTARILADTRTIDHSLRQQRPILYDAHKRICAVTKGSGKPAA